jgi:hypothetical protein
MDAGKWKASSSTIILYVVRLVVRVESYLLFLIRHHHWLSRVGSASKTSSKTYPKDDLVLMRRRFVVLVNARTQISRS